MQKDGIDYLAALSLHVKGFLSIFTACMVVGLVPILLIPEEHRIVSVASIGNKMDVTGNSPDGLSIQLLEGIPSTIFRLRQLILPELLQRDEFADPWLQTIRIDFSNVEQSNIIVMEARVSKEQTRKVRELLTGVGAELIAEHNERFEAGQQLLLGELETVDALIAAVESQQDRAGDIVRQQQDVPARSSQETVPDETREFLSWSRIVYGVQATSSLGNQYRQLVAWRSALTRALTVMEQTTIELDPSVDTSTSYGPGILTMLLILVFTSAILATGGVGLMVLTGLVKERKANLNQQV